MLGTPGFLNVKKKKGGGVQPVQLLRNVVDTNANEQVRMHPLVAYFAAG